MASTLGQLEHERGFFKPQTFVDRSAELAYVNRQLDRIRVGAPPEDAIYEVLGERGMGKTTLLYQMRDRASYMPTALIDFTGRDGQSLYTSEQPEAMKDLVINMGRQIEEGQSLGLDGFRLTRIEDLPESEVIGRFHEYIRDLLNYQRRVPILILLDSAQDCPQPLFNSLQQSVLMPLIETEKVQVVVGSRTNLAWSPFDVRKQVDTTTLGLFDEAQSRAQLEGPDYDIQLAKKADLVHAITGGWPGGNRFLYERLSTVEFDEVSDQDLEGRLRQELVENYIFRPEDPRPYVNTSFSQALLAVSPYRDLTFPRLKVILQETSPDIFASWKDSQFLELEQEMIRNGYIDVRVFIGMNPITGAVLSSYYSQIDPEKYAHAIESAKNYYKELISNSSPIYLADYLYYQVLADRRYWRDTEYDLMSRVGETVNETVEKLPPVEGFPGFYIDQIKSRLENYQIWRRLFSDEEMEILFGLLNR